ncbi:hypothetical protein K701_22905 [Streptomyces fradiae ATCC 10745 = DSM 40063]|uniref:Uncharacterized protein n=1 Tax=Streptomyces fradiae ATCC 10745 = DSM 40063 TaxID=1319510 RepID=A0ABQ6XPC2_STRFR|nr:hypothetical protein K701_22905 [Streptomyces fradiae ATCC 10745 = DSM 40063]
MSASLPAVLRAVFPAVLRAGHRPWSRAVGWTAAGSDGRAGRWAGRRPARTAGPGGGLDGGRLGRPGRAVG